MKTLDQKITAAQEEARQKVVNDAKAFCQSRGKHTWDSEFGRVHSGGGKEITGGFYEEGMTTEYTDTWESHQRKCTVCGEVEVSKVHGAEWRWDATQGHFTIDPRTGERSWVTTEGKVLSELEMEHLFRRNY